MKAFFKTLFSPIYFLLTNIINQLKTIITLQLLTVALIFAMILIVVFI